MAATLVLRDFVCFRSSYYNVPLEKISDDFPIEKKGTFAGVCLECGPEEVDEDILFDCLAGTHVMMLYSQFCSKEDDWILNHKKDCYFCMKPLYEDRHIRYCDYCKKDIRLMYQLDCLLNNLKSD